jgi:hypothetical protein
MDNGFLRNFLKARAAMNTSAPVPAAKASKGASESTISLEADEPSGITLATIIEESPPKAKVLEFLRKRILELEADDD